MYNMNLRGYTFKQVLKFFAFSIQYLEFSLYEQIFKQLHDLGACSSVAAWSDTSVEIYLDSNHGGSSKSSQENTGPTRAWLVRRNESGCYGHRSCRSVRI